MGNIVRELVQRADSWVNAMTGLGTLRDKLMHTQVIAGTKLTDPVLEALFNDDDVARRVVAKLPRDATRRGFRIKITEQQSARTDADGDEPPDPDEYDTPPSARAGLPSDEAATIERQMQQGFTRLEAMPKLRDGWIWARLYGGGSGIFVGADDGQDVEQPLNEDAIRSIKFLNVIKRPQLSIFKRYEDIREPQYARPELYTVNQASGILAPRTGLTVHESRLILFDGALTARMTMESPTGFDDSVLQSTLAPLQQTASAWQSIAHLMTDASQGVLKIANLVDLVAAGGTETLRSRIQLMDLARSVCRAILIDAEKESFERVSTSFAGLPEVMDRLMQRMCAAAEQPATLLYGRSPAGMNATGESDIRGWYDTVSESQTDELKPRLERLVRLMFLAKDGPTLGREPDDWCIEFNPLWLPTDKELAETKKLKADTYVALVGGNIMTDAEAGIGLASDFPEIDVESRTDLAEADKAEGVRPREVNTPEPPELDPNDPEGGGNGGIPKADSSQPRVPAGSARGGQWTSGGGGGGSAAGGVGVARAAAAVGGGGGGLTEAQRAGIRSAGTAAVMTSLQQKLVQRYGVPAKQAALMYERDIKQQLKAAKAQRAESRAFAKAHQAKGTEAVDKSLTAMRKAVQEHDERQVRNAQVHKEYLAKGAAMESARRKAAAAKGAATRKANKAKKEAEAKAQQAEGAKTVDDVAAKIAETGGMLPGMRATTQLVRHHLGPNAERTAPLYSIEAKDLSDKNWGGYNDMGAIVLNNDKRDALLAPRKFKSFVEADAAVRAVEAKLAQAHMVPLKEWRVLKKQREEAREGRKVERAHEDAMRTLVHEELHSFGPLHQRGEHGSANRSLYKESGKVAEEVATEVLARDIVMGRERGMNHFGSYQTQINGVVAAMHTADTKGRKHAEHYENLVKASKTYKGRKLSTNLMETMHSAITAEGGYDSEPLRKALNAVTVPNYS